VLRERFSGPLDAAAAALSDSTSDDAALLDHDLWASLAHARMLGATGIVPRSAARRIEAGLRALARDPRALRARLDPALEDVHLNVEVALTRRIGPDGERLHTARSRNDQVATDLSLYLRDGLLALGSGLTALARTLVAKARGPDGRQVVDGWTHLQPAQRVYWAQLLVTHARRFARDAERCAATRSRIDESPLGSGALAGSSLPIDRALTARLLGFRRPSRSSIDGVSDRDDALEGLFDLALVHLHLSQLAEEIVIGSMPAVGRVHLSDDFVTTSSLMPHKRNPDLAELARAEAGPAIARLVGLLVVLKGLPAGYQRDLQAGKPAIFDGVDRGLLHLRVARGMIEGARFLAPPVSPASSTSSVEVADALVLAGVRFRTAHRRVGVWTVRLASAGRGLASVSRSELLAEFPELRQSPFRIPSAREEPERRRSHGGSSWREVERSAIELTRRLATLERETRRERERLRGLREAIGAREPAWLTATFATSRPAGRPAARGASGRRRG